MRLVLAAALALAPLPAFADDDPPPPSTDDAVAPPSSVPPTPADDHPWCHHDYHHGAWRWQDRQPTGRFALGIGHGRIELADAGDAGDIDVRSIVGRGVINRYLQVEVELAKFDDDTHTGGASLIHTIGRRHLQPYLIAGVGGGETASNDRLHYAELGVGLMLQFQHLALGVDMRHGVRHVDADAEPAALMTTMPTADDDHQHYVRGRVLALVYF